MKHDHNHHHECQHNHDHHFTLKLIILYFIGLALYIASIFVTNQTLVAIFCVVALILAGFHVIYEGIYLTVSQSYLHKKFLPNVHLLMTLAAIGAIIIKNYQEAALLILIFAGAHYLQEYAEGKSKKEITKLLKLNPTTARIIKEDGSISIVNVDELKIGDTLKVLNGDQIATDGVVVSGYSSIDQSSITGEAILVDKSVGDVVFGSTICMAGTFVMKVTKNSSETVFAKIIKMVSNAQTNISKTAAFIKRLEPKYVTAVLILAPLVFLSFYYLFGFSLNESFNRSMVFLIVTSPCALAVTDIPASLSAISSLAKSGVLFKGGSYLANFADVKAIAFDKTGTLTYGKLVVTNFEYLVDIPQINKDFYNLVINSMEKSSNHPISLAVIKYLNTNQTFDFTCENILGVGIKASYENHEYLLAKPSYFNYDQKLNNLISNYQSEGKSVTLFAVDNVITALIAVSDIPKESSLKAVKYFNDNGIATILLTGDAINTANFIGNKVGVSRVVGNMLPDQKAQSIIDLKKEYNVVAMVGDGINDAPALVNADIGIAMGDGTDIAIDVCDVVLVKNDLSKIVNVYQTARKLRRVVWQNIIFAMLVVLFLVVMNFLGLLNLTVAVSIHEGSTLIVILSGLRLLIPIKGDKL